MQMRVLQQAGPAGANLASSLNISAFNLGNALGAWVGGLVLSYGFGLLTLGWAAAGLTVVGLLMVLASTRRGAVIAAESLAGPRAVAAQCERA